MSVFYNDFWKGKKVFITGHTGFKGAWLTLWLDMLGAEVYGYSLAPKEPSLYSDAGLTGKFGEVFGDIRKGELLKEKMASFAPDIVFHLAAQPLVRASYREPVLTYETNVMGTVNLLEAVRIVPAIRGVVVVTTDKCYRDMNWEWGYRETDTLGGADPYSSSKACAELVCDAWRSAYFTKTDTLLASARAGNVIGGGDWAEDRLVPDAIRAFTRGKSLEIRSPNAVRPWQHVLEPLSGYLTLAEHLYRRDRSCACGWNFGPPAESSRSVKNVVEILTKLWGDQASYEVAEDHTLHESYLLRLDSSKAMQKLDWHPILDFEDGANWTVEWYKRVAEGEHPLRVTREQLEHHKSLSINHNEGGR